MQILNDYHGRQPGRKKIKDVDNADPHTADAGSTATLLGINCYSIEQISHRVLLKHKHWTYLTIVSAFCASLWREINALQHGPRNSLGPSRNQLRFDRPRVVCRMTSRSQWVCCRGLGPWCRRIWIRNKWYSCCYLFHNDGVNWLMSRRIEVERWPHEFRAPS
jgi:hypothetical protein